MPRIVIIYYVIAGLEVRAFYKLVMNSNCWNVHFYLFFNNLKITYSDNTEFCYVWIKYLRVNYFYKTQFLMYYILFVKSS